MISLFILSWLPYALIAQFGIIGLDFLVTPYSAEIPIMLAKASAIWNPVIYALTNPSYKIAFQKLCPCCENVLCSKEATDSVSKSDGSSYSIRRQLHKSMTAASPEIQIFSVEN